MNSSLTLACVALCTLSACSILPEPTPAPLYFIALADDPAPAPETNTSPTPLHLSPVTAAPAIGERFASSTGNEMRFDDMQRWHEPPAVTLERRLGERLFERLGYTRATWTSTPKLTVHLQRFELDLDRNETLVRAHVVVTDGQRNVLVERTLMSRSPAASREGTDVAMAMGRTLDSLVESIVALVP